MNECFIPGGGVKNIKGVIYVSQDISESQIVEKAIVENEGEAEIEDARRFKKGGTAVLLTFKKEVTAMPTRIYLGYMSFRVKEYIRPPMRCYKCQRFGHAAAACRGDRRCGKCGGSHEFAQCKAEEAKCCNCGGNHVTSYRGCKHHVVATEIEKVRAGGEMSYAEAVRKVKGTGETTKTVRAGEASNKPPEIKEVGVQVVEKHAFFAFITDVLYGISTRKSESRSNVIQIVVEAAQRYLGEFQVDPNELHAFMRQNGQNQQSNQEKATGAAKEREGTGRSEQMEEGTAEANEDGDD